MGGSESVVRNVDKRTSRREHRGTFDAAVRRFRAAPFPAPPQPQPRGGAVAPADRFVRVCVRKRPIFPHELEQGEFDVVTCLPGRVVVHDARMHPDMRHMFMNHHDFAFDEALGETADNDAVYAATARDLVYAVLDGTNATVMMYGQTGSGKTYTMTSVYERVARDLFEDLGRRQVTTSFVELSGDKCFDMLNAGEQCQLTQAGDGSVHPFPCVEVAVKDARELLGLITLATKLRATAATGVHDQSSRSHAVCRIFVDGPDGPAGEGCLTLVDLAGSEHRIDNQEHNAERRKEGAKINASLAALKECIRSASRGAKFVAFRQNRLTQILRGCFSRQEKHQTVVIATVSPSSKDTEHSMNTLRHACIMDGQGEQKSGQSAHLAGGVVTKEVLGEIDVTKIAREQRARAKTEVQDDWGKVQAPPAHQSKQSNLAARAALDRRATQALPARVQQALLAARNDRIYGNDRQRARMSRVASAPGDNGGPAPLQPLDDDDDEEEECAAQEGGDTGQATPSQPTPQGRTPATGSRAGPRSPAAPPGPDAAKARFSDQALAAALERAGAEGEQAFELFRLFVTGGRAAQEWRKNDLRLISTFVVPALFGDGASLTWTHPALALDQLEELVKSTPPSSYLQGGRDGDDGGEVPPPAAGPARPPRPQQPPGPGGARLAAGEAAACRQTSGYPPPETPSAHAPSPQRCRDGGPQQQGPPGRAAQQAPPRDGGAPQRTAPGREAAAQQRSSFGSQSQGDAPAVAAAREGSPAGVQRVPSATSSASASSRGGPPCLSHRDAVRARREAMEKARKDSLLQALEKRTEPSGRDEEIESLERQIAAGGQSAAALVGLKKRVAALKAQAMREQRAAAERRRELADADEAPRAAPAPARLRAPTPEQGRAPTPDRRRAVSPEQQRRAPSPPPAEQQRRPPRYDDLPEPVVPPPRFPRPAGLPGGSQPGTPANRVPSAGSLPGTPANRGVDPPWAQGGGGGRGGGWPPPCGFEAARPGGDRRAQERVGAAAAPWGNSFTCAGDAM